ncbi:hypothetical protein P691DRAFT_697045 [Macrolepiota fuliginosa MF-IS2]|uniref:S-adenosyl-L-methionine-dependent methyltransferase n=1 Tax=Macrolepiota fuliginosa MF-IS2 TaxID=1400762 RepID=A0A9P5XMI0_9AGAR|nr:hypothetical protein P691DRAFT_697045 [Macrolepiota fuliginosa MF-IS2]
MFYYISFLRPPPTQSSPTGTIAITPQISNDLRTEQYEASQDIYYSWAPYPQTPSSSPTNFTLKTTKPLKLTTYRNSSAYKEIPVPVPPGVREGQHWQLILSSSAQTTALKPNYGIDTHEPTIGSTPFPVISMPILFSAKGFKGNAKKQERIERIYRITNVAREVREVGNEATETVARNRELKITEQTSFDLDKKIWDSGIGLSSWLLDFQNLGQSQRTRSLEILWDALFSAERRHMVELGAGTGIVSLVVASLRAHFNTPEHQEDRIITTDLESAIPLLDHNITSNLSLYLHNAPKAEILDWEDENLPECINALGNIDVILMSDVTYNTSSFPALVQTVMKLMGTGEKPPVVLLGYKERDSAERELWEMMEAIGLCLEKIGERRGAADPAVEVWFGHFDRTSAAVP